jgi:exonuclease III
VRRLNSRAQHDVVHELVVSKRPSIICLQETKLDVISHIDIVQLLGIRFEYAYLKAAQTRGGILVVWHSSSWLVANSSTTTFPISAKFRSAMGGPEWRLASVYGPCTDEGKPAFLTELRDLSLM